MRRSRPVGVSALNTPILTGRFRAKLVIQRLLLVQRSIQSLLVALALLLIPMQAHAAKKKNVLVLQAQSDGLDEGARSAATAAIREQLAKYPKVVLLDTPEFDFLEMMMELECVDVDAACLVLIGKNYKADTVVYTEAEPGDADIAIKMQVIDVKRGKAREFGASAGDAAAMSGVLPKLIINGFGEVPKAKAKPKPKPPKAVGVTIKANVEGANVYINGELAGRTTLKAKLAPGTYKIRLSKDGFKDREQPLVLKAGKRATLAVEMEKAAVIVAKPDPDFPPPEKEPGDTTPFYKTWWFWTTIGVAVAGGVTAAVLLSGDDDPATTGTMNFGFGSPDYDPLVLEAAQ
ncbi:MAG: hypothetical protein ACI9WU_004513 [Myxococcota bacterium]|jgi:hypothetical protein